MVIRAFAIPGHWLKFRSFDWGSARPFSVGWWAVASEDTEAQTSSSKRIIIPKKALVRYREWYGVETDAQTGKIKPNVGLRLTAEKIAAGILERELLSDPGEKPRYEEMTYGVADPSAFTSDGGPSIMERMNTAGAQGWRKADNRRVGKKGHFGGWDQMRARMDGEGGSPMIYSVVTNVNSHRTIPLLQHDEKKPEDLDTNQEDHAADDWRYACMSRPYAKPLPPSAKAIDSPMTFNDLVVAKKPDDERI